MNEERRKLLDNIIKRQGLGALIFWRPDELVLTTGYLPQWGVSFLLYTRDGGPVLFVPELEPEDILPADIAIRRFPGGVLEAPDPWQVLYDSMKAVLAGRSLDGLPLSFISQIGSSAHCRMAGEQPPLPMDLTERLAMLSEGGFKDCSSDILALYSYKTAQDIVALERAHKVAVLAVDVFYRSLVPGRTEAAVAAAVESAVQEATGSEGVEYARAWTLIQSGGNAAFAGRFNRSTGKKLKDAELVLMETAVCVNGYWADITRTAQTSAVSTQHRKIFGIVAEAQAAAIECIRPGVTMGAVDAIARAIIQSEGYGHLYLHALGHPVGFRYHDPGAGLSPGSEAVLREGMVLTVEPGIYGEEIGCGIRLEDNILVTADGCRILSDYPRTIKL